MSENFLTLLSLISLGFVGGFSHCIGMCGPFVMTQIGNNLSQVQLKDFTILTRLKNVALLPYHFGRITTYSFLGFASSFLTKSLENFSEFRVFSKILLIAAAFYFLFLLLGRKGNFQKFHQTITKRISKISLKIRLPFKSLFLENLKKSFRRKFVVLFENPRGFKGYLLGIILGFIPCGLLYSAIAIAASITIPSLAALGLALFGAATFPALFFTGAGMSYGANFFSQKTKKFVFNIIILLNILSLLILSLKI